MRLTAQHMETRIKGHDMAHTILMSPLIISLYQTTSNWDFYTIKWLADSQIQEAGKLKHARFNMWNLFVHE